MATVKTWDKLTPEEKKERRTWLFLYLNDYDFWRAQEQKWQDLGMVPRHRIMTREEWERQGPIGRILTPP